MQRKFIDDFYRESEKCLTPYSQILKAFTPNLNIEDRFVECNLPSRSKIVQDLDEDDPGREKALAVVVIA